MPVASDLGVYAPAASVQPCKAEERVPAALCLQDAYGQHASAHVLQQSAAGFPTHKPLAAGCCASPCTQAARAPDETADINWSTCPLLIDSRLRLG